MTRGKPIIQLGKNLETASRARIEIEAMRLMVLKAAKAMDVLGNREARVWVSMVKAMVPERVCQIIDQAIQIHGATGISQWTPLADMYTNQRHRGHTQLQRLDGGSKPSDRGREFRKTISGLCVFCDTAYSRLSRSLI